MLVLKLKKFSFSDRFDQYSIRLWPKCVIFLFSVSFKKIVEMNMISKNNSKTQRFVLNVQKVLNMRRSLAETHYLSFLELESITLAAVVQEGKGWSFVTPFLQIPSYIPYQRWNFFIPVCCRPVEAPLAHSVQTVFDLKCLNLENKRFDKCR